MSLVEVEVRHGGKGGMAKLSKRVEFLDTMCRFRADHSSMATEVSLSNGSLSYEKLGLNTDASKNGSLSNGSLSLSKKLDLNNNSLKDLAREDVCSLENDVCSLKNDADDASFLDGSVEKQKMPTFEEIRNAIPKQCFEKDLKLSLFYLVLDYAILAGLFYLVPYVEKHGGWWGLILWYYVVGMFGMSLFVVGHDCGHGTFSNYTWVNDICGHIAHAPLLAPYWPWQKSHRLHHTHTGNLEKDRGHAWMTEERYNELDFFRRHFKRLPISGLFLWQTYTMLGLPDGSHFYPFSELYTNATNKERWQCVVSGLACAFCGVIAFVLCDYDWRLYVKYYYVSLLFFGLWLVMITYLQHQDEEIEVYENDTWSYVKGQSQTIDRKYGFGIDTLTHHITDCHVVHHFFFTKIPHYHLPEATRALKKVVTKYPGVYKAQKSYDYLFRFLRMNVTLDYLIGKGTGLLKYRTSKTFQEPTSKKHN